MSADLSLAALVCGESFPFLRSRRMLVRPYRGPIYVMEVPVQISLGVRLSLELREEMVPHPGIYPAVEAGGDASPGAKLLR